jgi:hypothetical protein
MGKFVLIRRVLAARILSICNDMLVARWVTALMT